MESIIELYNYREMLFNQVKKDLRTRYKGSVLGFLWTFVNPLLQLIVYSVVFSLIMRVTVENFTVYLFIGLTPWMFFAGALQGSSSSIIANKDLVKKIYFPRIIIPLSVATGVFMNLVFTMPIVFLALMVSGIGFSWYVLLLPLIMILEYLFVIGMCLIISSFNVFFRDLEHILSIVIMAWFYFTPIVFTMEMVPKNLQHLFYLNPMTAIIGAYRDILYYQRMPNWTNLGAILFFSVTTLILGYSMFQKLQKSFVEEL